MIVSVPGVRTELITDELWMGQGIWKGAFVKWGPAGEGGVESTNFTKKKYLKFNLKSVVLKQQKHLIIKNK